MDDQSWALSGNVSYACDFIKRTLSGVTLKPPAKGTHARSWTDRNGVKTHEKTIDDTPSKVVDGAGVAAAGPPAPFFAQYGIRGKPSTATQQSAGSLNG